MTCQVESVRATVTVNATGTLRPLVSTLPIRSTLHLLLVVQRVWRRVMCSDPQSRGGSCVDRVGAHRRSVRAAAIAIVLTAAGSYASEVGAATAL
jgi:hypothetical protein